MYIVFCIRCGDQEDQSDRFTVQCIKINSILHNHCRKARSVNCIALSVGNCDPLPDSCGALLFSGVDLLSVGLLVIDLTALCHQSDRLVKCLLLAFWGTIQGNTSLVQ